ncbi:zinc finger protein PLAG1 isoform X2 [Nilaparvata lugens]|uniref:zinc finger protein PLAG1 isoform X2 n=1 Tax=Nilaparvata lugens TaxID=108931 RepID=UPI000B989604|nr:zinc finger protein PLAG1 isoform X2 [Nilaparvata lugens]XP_039298975.1 zinc finger protein PLAG1 isoform X2 [Nilaparvata lugens]
MGSNPPSDLRNEDGTYGDDGAGIVATPPTPVTPIAGVSTTRGGERGTRSVRGASRPHPRRGDSSRRRLFATPVGSHIGEDTAGAACDGVGESQPQPSSSGEQRVLAARHLCPKCPKTFGSPGKLSQHMYSHTGERPFACQFCPKAFSSKFKLVRHMLIHSDQRQYTCQMCERTFHRKDHLKNHAKVHDPIKSIYTCNRPGCGKQYSSLLSFRKHTAVHAAEDGNLECTMCGQKFASKEEIVFHLKVHAGSRTVKTAEDRKYHCDHCDRSFFTGKDVRRHMVVHTGKRDFLCQFCPQRFGRKDHLVRHIKKSHSSPGKKVKTKRAEAKTKTVDSILVETGRSKIQPQLKPSSSSKPSATITSGELYSNVSQEANLMSEFEEPKDSKSDIFRSHLSGEHGCVAPMTVVEISASSSVMSNLLSPSMSSSEMSNLVYESEHVYSEGQYPIDDNNESSTAILRTVDAHQFDQPAASSSSSPSYSAMIDSFGLELKPGDLEDLKPEDIAPMSENPTSHQQSTMERNLSIDDLPLIIPILPQEEHLQLQAATRHFLATDETSHLSRHIISLTAPAATQQLLELPHYNISATQESVSQVQDTTPTPTPLPRFNQAFQHQPPPPK